MMDEINADIIRMLQKNQPVEQEEALPSEGTVSLYGKTFTPITYPLAARMVARFEQHGVSEPLFIDKNFFRWEAFEKAKKACEWDIELGARAFEIVDMRTVFLAFHDLDTFFDCYFMKTPNGSPYRAWFHENKQGIIRYYTVSPFDENEEFVFDAIDLYGAVFGGQAILNHLEKRYLRHASYRMIREHQTLLVDVRVLEERERLEAIAEEIALRQHRQAPFHSDATLFAVLNTFLQEAKARTFMKGHYDADGRTVFFMGTDELAKRITQTYADRPDVKKSKATLNNAINVLAALGYIEKLTDNALERAQREADLVSTRNTYAINKKNPISYYIIRPLPSLYWVKKQGEKLLKKRVTLHNVTHRNFKRALGTEAANAIFVVDYVVKKEERFKNEKRAYMRAFLMAMKQKGAVTKEELAGIIPSVAVTDKLWTALVNETRGFYMKRTTKESRARFLVQTTGAVFISLTLAHPNEPETKSDKTQAEVLAEQLEREYDALTEHILHWYADVFDAPSSSQSEWEEIEAIRHAMSNGTFSAQYSQTDAPAMLEEGANKR